jgi:glycosyltransferase involved in cell wall biosynthesis
MKALCVFSTLLGHKTVVHRLKQALSQVQDLDPVYILIGIEDYAANPAPGWARLTGPWEGDYVARRKLLPVNTRDFDLVVVNTWELAVTMRETARRLPAIMVMDSIPATVDAQLRRQGQTGLKRSLVHLVHQWTFGKVVREFDYFLPKSSNCVASLQVDFGVPRDRCFITLAPQDLALWRPRPRSYESPTRLLFVGNDFVRKGGEFLLRLYAAHLADQCTLTIASNDPSLANRPMPPGVQLLSGRGRDQMLKVFQDSDIFVLPSRQDYTPEVVAEALAVGLPCLMSDVDGATDLIQEGETGFIMQRDSGAEVWAAHIHRLAANPSELARMSLAARRFAEDRLALDRFAAVTAGIVERLRGGKQAWK